MTRQDFWEAHKEGSFETVGMFSNEHGEQFVMYKRESMNVIFITGDELDWELWQYQVIRLIDGSFAIANMFLSSPEEKKKIDEILRDYLFEKSAYESDGTMSPEDH